LGSVTELRDGRSTSHVSVFLDGILMTCRTCYRTQNRCRRGFQNTRIGLMATSEVRCNGAIMPRSAAMYSVLMLARREPQRGNIGPPVYIRGTSTRNNHGAVWLQYRRRNNATVATNEDERRLGPGPARCSRLNRILFGSGPRTTPRFAPDAICGTSVPSAPKEPPLHIVPSPTKSWASGSPHHSHERDMLTRECHSWEGSRGCCNAEHRR
jgi:hypothetical protein